MIIMYPGLNYNKLEQGNPPSTGWPSDMNGNEKNPVSATLVTPPTLFKTTRTPSKDNHPHTITPLPELRNLGALPLSEPNTPASSTVGAPTFTTNTNWKEAMDMIRNNPSLVTPRIFWTALEQNPPSELIERMLSITPQVARIPKQGPTALQVAVQNGASMGVIQALLKACPFALCITNPHHGMDPLSYAKRHRTDERGVIELLSRPLSDWIRMHTQNDKQQRDPKEERMGYQSRQNSVSAGIDSSAPSQRQRFIQEASPTVPTFFPILNPGLRKIIAKGATGTATSTTTDAALSTNADTPAPAAPAVAASTIKDEIISSNKNSSIDRQELNNVKLLCAQVLKGHKKLSKQMKACQEQLQAMPQQPQEQSKPLPVDMTWLLTQIDQQQQDHFRHQLIALEMKERAFLARVQKMEDACQKQTKDQLSSFQRSWEAWKSQSMNEWNEWKVLLDNERKVNTRFRNDFIQWLEQDGSTNNYPHWEDGMLPHYDHHRRILNRVEDDDYRHGRENEDDTPIIFATNLGEVSECAPLCESSNDSSSSSSGSGTGNEDDTPVQALYDRVAAEDDELLQIPRSPPVQSRIQQLPQRPYMIRRRRHPWNPLVRKWDHIIL